MSGAPDQKSDKSSAAMARRTCIMVDPKPGIDEDTIRCRVGSILLKQNDEWAIQQAR